MAEQRASRHEQRRERQLRAAQESDDRQRAGEARRGDDDARQLKYLAPIEPYVATNVPIIPTVYGAAFDEYNTAHFSGWPSASDPYESGSPNAPTNEVVVLHLKPKRLAAATARSAPLPARAERGRRGPARQHPAGKDGIDDDDDRG